jgi:hypothetical protein
MGPYGFSFKRTRHTTHSGFGHRHGEVVGPKQSQAFVEGLGAECCRAQARPQVTLHDVAKMFCKLLFGGLEFVGRHPTTRVGHGLRLSVLYLRAQLLPFTHKLVELAQPLQTGRQAFTALRLGRADLCGQPALGVSANASQAGLAQTKPVRGNRRLRLN